MRISTKGQVTIPHEIRDQLGLDPGTEVEFAIAGDAALLKRKDGLSRGQALVEHLRRSGENARLTGMTTDELMALTRGE